MSGFDFVFDELVRDSEANFPHPVPELIGFREEIVGNVTAIIEYCLRCNEIIHEGRHTCSDIYFLLWNTYIRNKNKDTIKEAKKRLGF